MVNTAKNFAGARRTLWAPSFRLSREERDHIAGHALDSISRSALSLCRETRQSPAEDQGSLRPSDAARRIAALSNLLGDIGWEREALDDQHPEGMRFILGELFPVAQLRPWLEEWQRQDDEVLAEAQAALDVWALERYESEPHATEGALRKRLADAQTKLGTGAILLARIEKWMACKEN